MVPYPVFPCPPLWAIPWESVESLLAEFVRPLSRTEQNQVYHGEGDVWSHTKLVCEELVKLPDFRKLEEQKRQAVFLSALLHDVGKISTTRWDDGWISPNHSAVGAKVARQYLWQQLDLCGTPEKQRFRETVCSLVRFHGLPLHAIDDADGVRKLRTVAARGGLCPDFSVELLCLLAQADILGRICRDKETLLEQVALCRAMAEEAGCLRAPFTFPSAHTRHAFLSGRGICAEYPLYDDTWGQVILLCGLPGTGKDTWIHEKLPGLPVISLDDIRLELGISPTENQTPVVEKAREEARDYLRTKQAFVWNATNTTPMVRGKQQSLFQAYHASVRTVFLETTWEEQLRRNRERDTQVPEQVICRLLEDLEPPQPEESACVEWICV